MKAQTLNGTKNKHTTKNQYKNISFMDWISQYISQKQNSITKVTYIGYKRIEKTMRNYFEKSLKLKNLTCEHIQNYFKFLKEERKNKNSTIKHQTGLIYPAIKTAVKKNLLKINPLCFLNTIKTEKHPPTFYNKKDLKILFEKIKGNRAELAIKIDAYYGLRRSELIGLKWKSIDFCAKTITIENKLLIVNKEIISTNVLKTASSNRILPLLPEIEKDLMEHKKNLEKQRKIFALKYNTNFLDYVFVDEFGFLIRPSYVSQALRNIIRENKLRKIRFHDLRHSCASLLLANGVNIKNIQEWLGHSNFKTTADIYSHLEIESKIEAGKKIAKTLNFSKKFEISKNQTELTQEIKTLKKELKQKQNQLKILQNCMESDIKNAV